jgi:hypothetical protein
VPIPRFENDITFTAGASVLIAYVLWNQGSLPCSQKPATRSYPVPDKIRIIQNINKMHNIIIYNIELKFYKSNVFRSFLGHFQGWHYLKMRRNGMKHVKVEMFNCKSCVSILCILLILLYIFIIYSMDMNSIKPVQTLTPQHFNSCPHARVHAYFSTGLSYKVLQWKWSIILQIRAACKIHLIIPIITN